jgi:hypothetical protein
MTHDESLDWVLQASSSWRPSTVFAATSSIRPLVAVSRSCHCLMQW